MEDRLLLPAPNDPIECVHAIAYDLAYGVAQGMWDTNISIRESLNGDQRWQTWSNNKSKSNYFDTYINGKWSVKRPSFYMLLSFGYLESLSTDDHYYLLTQKAFKLLEEPPTAPKVFISYKRDCSSALALLVEAKLKLRDNQIGVFIDKLIKPGDDWAENIQSKIKQSRYFICLLAPDTYTESEWVRKELDWAYDAGCEIISVFHCGADLNDRYPVWLGKKQKIKVDFETAKHYESALDEILVGLGYSTY